MSDVPLEEIPTTLDAIVRRNRHLVELTVAMPPELDAITGEFDAVGAAKGHIQRWHAIVLRDAVAHSDTLHIVGWLSTGSAWITSPVTRFSSDRAVAKTANSYYRLGPPANGEIDIELLMLVAFSLRRWGLNDRSDLGVIEVFY
jgi:hypothetical protein